MILIDTGPLVALCDGRDSQHRTAMKHLDRFETDQLATCEAVVMEACFHLPHPAQRQRVRAVVEQCEITALPGTSDWRFWLEVLDWLAKYGDHEPDWADGCLAVLCGRNKALRVWTYDREFRTTWRRPDGTAIPMALRA